MIQISLSTAIGVYSTILGVVVVAIWIYTEISVRRSYHVLEKQFLWRCVYCAYTYLDEAAETVSECPRCGSFNSVDDHGARFVVERAHSRRHVVEEVRDKAARNPSRRKRPHRKRRGRGHYCWAR